MQTIKEEDQMNFADLGIWSGKTSPEPLAAKKAQTSRQSSKKSSASSSRKPPMCLCLKKDGLHPDASTMTWEDGALLGAYTTHSFGEQPSTLMDECGFEALPNGVGVSRLSQILEECPHPKYYLSAKACEGILRRAERRGKELPPMLKEALVAQSAFKSAGESRGGGKGILIQNERTGALSTLNNQSVFNIGSYHSNAWKSDNPHSGVYETEVSKTLDALNCGYPACNQGGTAVVCMATQQGGAEVRTDDRAPTLTAAAGMSGNNQPVVFDGSRRHDYQPFGDVIETIQTHYGTGGGNTPLVCGNPWDTQSERVYTGDGAWHSLNSNSSGGQSRDAIFCLQGNGIDRADTAGCNGKGWRENVSYTLNTVDRPAVYDARGNGDGETVCTITGDHQNRVTDYTALLTMQGFGDYMETGVASACKSRDYKDATDLVVSGIDARNGAENGDLCGTLQAKPNGGFSYNCIHPVRINKYVRRLTPLLCERLQGYPDGWTDIGEWIDSKGKRHDSSDSARYKALGNSIALPFWRWLMRRISAQYVGTPTLGSLFDGIGGFPLCWEGINGKRSARWASEIEEFPIAVTKFHFGGEE